MRTPPDRPTQADRGDRKSWRDVLPIHPAAELLPMMSADERKALGEDIRQRGLDMPIILWSPGKGVQHKLFLLDGRNRLDAMEAADDEGLPEMLDAVRRLMDRGVNLDGGTDGHGNCGAILFPGITALDCRTDPYAYVISANIHRRHLTPEQRSDLIIKVIERAPLKSDRQIAGEIGVDHKTVAAARIKGEDVGRIPHVEKRTDSKGRQQPARKPKRQTDPQPPETTAPATAPAHDDIGHEKATDAQPPETTGKTAAPTLARDDIGPGSAGEIERLRVRQEELDNEARRRTVAGTGCLAYPYQTLLRAWEGAPDDARQRFMTKVGLIADPFHIPEFMRREPVAT